LGGSSLDEKSPPGQDIEPYPKRLHAQSIRKAPAFSGEGASTAAIPRQDTSGYMTNRLIILQKEHPGGFL
jgi:hypothetical protein